MELLTAMVLLVRSEQGAYSRVGGIDMMTQLQHEVRLGVLLALGGLKGGVEVIIQSHLLLLRDTRCRLFGFGAQRTACSEQQQYYDECMFQCRRFTLF